MVSIESRLGIYYEHPDWYRPLFAELDRRFVPYDALHADDHRYDPSEAAPSHAVVFNRMSPSAHIRGRGHLMFYTLQYLAHLERLGVRVINGYEAWRTEISKAYQLTLLERLGLSAKRNAWFMTLSGGQKQRLFIALALIHEPELVFLDELTTGLDPQARRAIWGLITGIRDRGTTVFLTTHLMEEAERLCDRVAIIEHGRIIEVGTPAELVRKHCPERSVIYTNDETGVTETLRGTGDDFVTEVINGIARAGTRVRGFRTEAPTLEDVFLKLTGHQVRD